MRLLLDTHAALWWWADSPSLGTKARLRMEDPNNEIFFSSASAYEILQKVRLGRLAVPNPIRDDMASAVLKEGWLPLPLTIPEASLAASMQHAHRDPFDRMLAAQSQLNVIAIASTDLFFDELPVERIW